MEQKLRVLYEDEYILVVVKPAGIPTQTKRLGEQDMVSLLRNYRAAKGEEAYIGLVHRLDQPVEGILVFGKNKDSTAELSRQMATESFGKIYQAVIQGTLPLEEGVLEDYLKKDGKNNKSYVVSKKEPGAKRAVLEYQVIRTEDARMKRPAGRDGTGADGMVGSADNDGKSLLRIKLHTGRHHQIRVQLANQGTPIWGDFRYGFTGEKGSPLLALCASELYFMHPHTHARQSYQIEPSGKIFYWRQENEQDFDH